MKTVSVLREATARLDRTSSAERDGCCRRNCSGWQPVVLLVVSLPLLTSGIDDHSSTNVEELSCSQAHALEQALLPHLPNSEVARRKGWI